MRYAYHKVLAERFLGCYRSVSLVMGRQCVVRYLGK